MSEDIEKYSAQIMLRAAKKAMANMVDQELVNGTTEQIVEEFAVRMLEIAHFEYKYNGWRQ